MSITKRAQFGRGSIVREGAHFLTVHEIRPQSSQIVLEGEAGELRFFKLNDFYNEVAQGNLRPIYQHGIERESLPPRVLTIGEKIALDRNLEYLNLINTVRGNGGTWRDVENELILRYESEAPSLRQVQRIFQRGKLAEDVSELAPLYSARGNRTGLIIPEVQGVLVEVLEEFLVRSDKFNVSAITILVNDRARKLCAELRIPFQGMSRRTISRAICSIAESDRVKGRLDPRTARQVLAAAFEYLFVEAPYQRVEFDATPLNLLVVDSEGNIIGKPTLYLLVDCATGVIIAFHLSIQAESQETFLRLLEMAFTPRDKAFLERYGVQKALPPPALWHVQVGDNSAAHHGAAMFRALTYLGVTVEFTQAGKPQQRPYVERSHGSVKTGVIQKLCGSNISQEIYEKDPYGRSVQEAKYTLKEAESMVARWICDVYMGRPLKRLNERFGHRCSPRQAMDILTRKYPLIPPPTPEEFRNACMTYEIKEARIRRDGVKYKTFNYQSEELYELFLSLPANSKVEVRSHPLDVSCISVVSSEKEKVMVTAWNKLKNLPPMSFAEAKFIRSKFYKSDAELSAEEYIQGYAKLLEDVNAKNKSKKVSSKQQSARATEKQQQSAAIKKSRTANSVAPEVDADERELNLQALKPLPTRK